VFGRYDPPVARETSTPYVSVGVSSLPLDTCSGTGSRTSDGGDTWQHFDFGWSA
jgi:hypothetical protein